MGLLHTGRFREVRSNQEYMVYFSLDHSLYWTSVLTLQFRHLIQ